VSFVEERDDQGRQQCRVYDDDVFLFVVAETKSAQSYIPQGHFPPYEAV
jgi:hypothetical protein